MRTRAYLASTCSRWRSTLLLQALLVATLAPLGCAPSTPRPTLHVLAFTPAVHRESQELRLQFSGPAVAQAQVGPELRMAPVVLQPPAPVRAHWADRQTLVLTATDLHPATRYTVKLAAPLADLVVEKSFAFTESPLTVRKLSGIRQDFAPSTGFDFQLTFDLPVRAAQVAEHCRILLPPAQASDPLARLLAVEPDRIAADVTLRAPRLPAGAVLHLHCADVLPAQGDAPLDPPFDATFTVARPFAVSRAVPAVGARVDPDEAQLELAFTTPVSGKDLARAVHLDPPVPSLAERWSDGAADLHSATIDLEPRTSYRLTIDPTLADVYGQPLGTDATPTFAFTTGGGLPRMRLDGDVHTVETGRTPLLWSRNLEQVHVRCALLTPVQVAGRMGGIEEVLHSWNQDKAIDWKGLDLREFDLDVRGEVDKWHPLPLALPKACGKGQQGVVLAEVASPELARAKSRPWNEPPVQRTVVNVTDLGIVLKHGPESGLVWVAGLHDGKPVADARVRIFSSNGGAQTWLGKTDAQGLAHLPPDARLMGKSREAKDSPLEGSDRSPAQAVLWAVVDKAGDLGVTASTWRNGIQPWQFDVRTSWYAPHSTLRGTLFTDRGIYRPGEVAHFKGIVRHVDAHGMTVPTTRKAHVTIRDARDAVVLEQDVTMTEFGGLTLDLPLGEEAALGDWSVQATVDDLDLRQTFLVQEFRRRTFEVHVTAAPVQPRQKTPLLFTGEARYLFGAPVAGAQVTWKILKRRHSTEFSGYEEFAFDRSPDTPWYAGEDSDENAEPAADATTTTDAQGHFSYALTPAREDGDGAVDYIAVAEVVDPANDSVTGRAIAVWHATDFQVGVQSPWLADAGKPVRVRTVALQPSGQAVATAARLHVDRHDWACDRDYECRENVVTALDQPIQITASVTDVPVTLATPGDYRLTLTATDAAGQKTLTSAWLWVSGTGMASWRHGDEVKIGLVADRRTYAPGMTARLLAPTGLTHGSVLATLERTGVLSARVEPLTGGASTHDFLLTGEHAPNVFASVLVVSGRQGQKDNQRPQLQMGLTELTVEAMDRRLDVAVATAQSAYEPGQEVTATVHVSQAGQPVVGEVAISVADEGVLQIVGFRTPDPSADLYAPWDLAVETATNWTRLLRPTDPRTRDVDEGGDAATPQVRKRFLSSAFWAASLKTDEQGNVTVHFPAPDNLTAFRVMAIAADAGARFGSGDHRFTVRKPLQAQPIAPRFVTPGDDVELGVLVHNHTGHAGEATVRASSKGMHLATTQAKVQLPADGSVRVPFAATALLPVAGQDPGPDPHLVATLRFDVALGNARDAVEIELPVVDRLQIDRQVLGRGRATGAIEVPVAWPTDALVAHASHLEIAVDRTGLSALQPALKSLIAYPYGCLEQTLSRLVPMAQVRELADVAGLDGLRGPTLDRYLAAGVLKLQRFQDADTGHFSLWRGGRGEPHYTVYAMQGILEAQRAHVPLDAAMVAKGRSALRNWVAQQSAIPAGPEAGTLAIAAAVLAELGDPDPGANARLFAGRAGLTRFAQAYVLRALAAAHAPEAQRLELLRELTGQVVVEGQLAHLPERPDHLDDWWWPTDRDVRPTATLLQALLAQRPDDPLVPKLAEYLLQSARQDGSWANTHDDAYAVTALASWARNQAAGQAHVTVTLAGRPLADEQLSGHAVLHLDVAAADVHSGTLRVTTDGPVRYLVQQVVGRREGKPLAQDHGLAVTRTYTDAQTDQPVVQAKAGQLLRIHLEVASPQGRRDIALVDPLPAGFEAVRVEEVHGQGDDEDGASGGWAWNWAELRDEEVRAFADSLPPGTTSYQYLARALVSGRFTAAPATVEAMYQPEVRGRSAGVTMAVR